MPTLKLSGQLSTTQHHGQLSTEGQDWQFPARRQCGQLLAYGKDVHIRTLLALGQDEHYSQQDRTGNYTHQVKPNEKNNVPHHA